MRTPDSRNGGNSVERTVKLKLPENKQVVDLQNLLALAQYNEQQKSINRRRSQKKKTNGNAKKTTLENDRAKSGPSKIGEDTETFDPTGFKDPKPSKIIQNLVRNQIIEKNLNESTVVLDARVRSGSQVGIKKFGKPVDENAAYFAPYKSHPLFEYLKTRNGINLENLIQLQGEKLENSDTPRETVTLILKPMARAVAGLEGKAMAMPMARAIVERGTNTDILFEPDAVAIVGPGGIAHAQSELQIGYID